MRGKGCGEGSVLPDHDSGVPGKKRTEDEQEEVEVSHAGEDQARAETPDEAKQFDGGAANSGCVEIVNCHVVRQRRAMEL